MGDVKTDDVVRLAKMYFGRLPASPKPEPICTVEPPQTAERTVVLKETSQPFYIEGFHRPSTYDPDDAVYDAISDLMTSGRTSRLYRSLVRDRKIAADAAGFSGFPGDKYPNLFAFYAVPTPGHTPEEMKTAIREEIEKLKTTDVTPEELKMVKTRAKANLIRKLADNEGLSYRLAIAQTRFGDWREVFRRVDAIDKVTAADIRRVANATFVESNRTVGIIESTQMATTPRGRSEMNPTTSLVCIILALFLTISAGAQVKDWKEIQNPPLREFNIPEAKRIELSNGAVVFLQEDHELPLIQGTIFIRGGSREETAQKIGLVKIYGEVWRTGGTKDENRRRAR